MSNDKEIVLQRSADLVTAYKAEAIPLSVVAQEAEARRHAEAAAALKRKARAEATTQAYETDWNVFERWAFARNLVTLPASPEVIARYVTALTLGEVETLGPGKRVHAAPKKPASISRALSAIKFVHKKADLGDPVTDDVREVLDGFSREVGTAQRRAAPITRELLHRALDGTAGALPPKDVRDRAILAIGWAGAMREAEITGLQLADVELVPQGLLLSLPFRKTDQQGKGTLLRLPRDGTAACPVHWFERWRSIRSISSIGASTPLFVSLRGRTAGQGLTPEVVCAIVRQRMAAIGLDAKPYSGHSLRAGFITAWISAGGNLADLMAHTGHTNLKTLSKYARGSESWTKRPWER